MRTLTIELPGRPPTPNVHRHWRTIANDNAEWKDIGWLAAMKALERASWPLRTVIVRVGGTRKRPKMEPRQVAIAPMAYAKVVIAIVVPTKGRRDTDNGTASMKPIMDAMVTAGVIVDDDYEHIGQPEIGFVIRPGQSRVVIRFTEFVPEGMLGL